MKKGCIMLVVAALIWGCASPRLVSQYDEVIDRGIMEFAVQFNTHLRNMGDLAGTPEGTYQANLKIYNALEARLDVLIARASAASLAEGCTLEQKVYERVRSLLGSQMPAQIQTGERSVEPEDAGSCNERLLSLVKTQLDFIQSIHKDKDQCAMNGVTCLRPAVVRTASKIANQSINAAAIVENAKKP